jgi:hypothetical protein
VAAILARASCRVRAHDWHGGVTPRGLRGHGATYIGEPTDAEEAGPVEWFSLAEIPDMMARGELAGSGTLVGLLHLLAFGKPKVSPSA